MSKRSPLFYVGDKYKLIDEIKSFFPNDIRHFVEPFVGGGSAFMNVDAEDYLLNDIDVNVISIHRMLCEWSGHRDELIHYLQETATNYGLSCSYVEDIIPDNLKLEYPKTYFAKFNKRGYSRLREDYNASDIRDTRLLYLLLIYGFNRMIRFNATGNFNVPVGNVDFNQNVIDALNDYFNIVSHTHIEWSSLDFRIFLQNLNLNNADLIYLDPPYLITFSEYNYSTDVF